MAEITPVGSEPYKDQVLDCIKDIGGNSVGIIILGAIIRGPKKLTILPYDSRPDKVLECQAQTSPTDPAAGVPIGLVPKPSDPKKIQEIDRGKWYHGYGDDEDTFEDERHKPFDRSTSPSTGGGTDVKIFFSPAEFGHSGCDGGAYGQMPDEILFHEMVHALRLMQGEFNAVPSLSLRYKNEEEFLAVVTTNVYMSKKGVTRLRKDYENLIDLEAPANTSVGFLKDSEHERILSHYAKVWQPIFGQLGNVDTAFNPFSRYNVNPTRASSPPRTPSPTPAKRP